MLELRGGTMETMEVLEGGKELMGVVVEVVRRGEEVGSSLASETPSIVVTVDVVVGTMATPESPPGTVMLAPAGAVEAMF